MKLIQSQPSLTQQVYDAIADDICDGILPAGAHLVQEQLAERLGVSRQPVQQAMMLLKADGMVEEIGRRGLQVIPLDISRMHHHYQIRGALDGLAARMAASRAGGDVATAKVLEQRGGELLRRGEAALHDGEVHDQVRNDMAFHDLIYHHCGNPLLPRTVEPHWRFLRRAMGEAMRHARLSAEIWRQHAEILEAIVAGDPQRAETASIDHAIQAAEILRTALADRDPGEEFQDSRPGSR